MESARSEQAEAEVKGEEAGNPAQGCCAPGLVLSPQRLWGKG